MMMIRNCKIIEDIDHKDYIGHSSYMHTVIVGRFEINDKIGRFEYMKHRMGMNDEEVISTLDIINEGDFEEKEIHIIREYFDKEGLKKLREIADEGV